MSNVIAVLALVVVLPVIDNFVQLVESSALIAVGITAAPFPVRNVLVLTHFPEELHDVVSFSMHTEVAPLAVFEDNEAKRSITGHQIHIFRL